MTTSTFAAGAYAAAQKLGAGGLVKPASATPSIGETGSFGALLQQVVDKTGASARKAEAAMVQAAGGKGDLVDVVTAIAESESAIETLVAVRDRVIQSYEEIMRMPI